MYVALQTPGLCQQNAVADAIARLELGIEFGVLPSLQGPLKSAYSSRHKWCPESEAGLLKTIVEHTTAVLFDAAPQDRSTIDMTMRVGVDRRANRPRRYAGIVKAKATVTAKQR